MEKPPSNDHEARALRPSGVHATHPAQRLLELHYRLASVLASASGLDAALEGIFDVVLGVDGIDVVGVYLRDEATGALTLIQQRGASDELIARASTLPASSPQARLVAAGRAVFRNHDELAAAIGASVPDRRMLRAVGVIPIPCEGTILGAQ